MKLMKCPDCGKLVSGRAVQCPDCGCPGDYFIEDLSEEEKLERKKKLQEKKIEEEKQQRIKIENDIESALITSFNKVYDHKDLQTASKLFFEDFKTKFSVSFPVSFVYDNETANSAINEIKNKEHRYPYIIIRSWINYSLEFKKYVSIKNNNRISRYYTDPIIPCLYAPSIMVITDNLDQHTEIDNAILGLYKEPKELLCPFSGEEETYIPFYCQDDTYTKPMNISRQGIRIGTLFRSVDF